MSILHFRQRHVLGMPGLPVVTPETEPMAARRRKMPGDLSSEADGEQNWGIALALAVWPLGLAAVAIYVVL